MAESASLTATLEDLVASNALLANQLFSLANNSTNATPSAHQTSSEAGIAYRTPLEYSACANLPASVFVRTARSGRAGDGTGNDLTKRKRNQTATSEPNSSTATPLQTGLSSTALVSTSRPATRADGGFAPSNSSIISTTPVQDLRSTKPQWHAPWKLMRVISGHLGWVRALAVEPGNQWFASGAGDRTIKIWDLASGTLRLTLTGHISTVRGLAVSDKHPYLFSCGEDKMVKCWDLETNKVIRHYHGHLSGVYTLALHPTLDVLVTGGRDGVARVWDMRTRSNIIVLSGHTATVSQVRCQEADPQVISSSLDSTVRLWDLAAGKASGVLTHHKKGVRALVTHPTEFTFATGSTGSIKQWKCPEGAFMQNFDGHNSIINTLSVNASNVLFSGGRLPCYAGLSCRSSVF